MNKVYILPNAKMINTAQAAKNMIKKIKIPVPQLNFILFIILFIHLNLTDFLGPTNVVL